MENQDETVAFLTSPAAFGSSPAAVRIVQTHISLVILSGERAIKLKRAVRLPYVDFSTPERRLAICQRELALNRVTAPALYRAVHKVTREPDGSLVLNGTGVLVDAIVEMARFDEDGLFDRLAIKGSLTAPILARLAHRVAEFHKGAAVDRSPSAAVGMAAVLAINESALATTTVFAFEEVEAFNAAFRRRLTNLSDLLDIRARAGKVRRCHGDLHLRNICLIDGEPTLFDCLEFDEAMATTDVLYDLAFLLMDLWHLDLRSEANLVFNRYLDECDEEDGLPLISFLMAVRAAVRAHVTATQAGSAGEDAAARRSEARSYFDLALTLLEFRPSRLIAVGGLSGSGKSTVAAGLAPHVGPPPGARILATDRIRKQMFNVPTETRLPMEAYRIDVSRQVYAVLASSAKDIVGHGHGAIADAVFDRPGERTRIEKAAIDAGVPFIGLWLDAGEDRLLQRVRSRTGDVSDATADVVHAQISRSTGTITWSEVQADADRETVRERALQAIAEKPPLDYVGSSRPSARLKA